MHTYFYRSVIANKKREREEVEEGKSSALHTKEPKMQFPAVDVRSTKQTSQMQRKMYTIKKALQRVRTMKQCNNNNNNSTIKLLERL